MSRLDLNFRHLRAFITVARLNSFTRAAKVLNLSQPALTKQVGQLEETLGIRLFDRNTRTVALTQIGKEISPVISQLLREVEGVLFDAKEIAAKNRGTIRVAAPPSLCSAILPTAIARFREAHPGITVELRDVLADRVLSLVKAEEVDFGVGPLVRKDMDIRFSSLLSDRMVAGLRTGHPLEERKSVSLRQLSRFPLVMMAAGSSVRTLVDAAFASIGQLIKPAYEVACMSTAAAIVQAGLGVAILPSTAVTMGELAGLVTRPISQPAITRELGIIEKAGRSRSPAAESFLRVINAVVEESGRGQLRQGGS